MSMGLVGLLLIGIGEFKVPCTGRISNRSFVQTYHEDTKLIIKGTTESAARPAEEEDEPQVRGILTSNLP